MAQFRRRTILAATDWMGNWPHTDINRFLLEHALEGAIEAGSRADRAMALGRYLIHHPDDTNEDGENLSDAVMMDLLARAVQRGYSGYPPVYDPDLFAERYPALQRGLERDGFTIIDGSVRRMLPDVIDLPMADDEVHELLTQYGFAVSRGHLDQGINAHARGEWAAANAQFRPFIESLFDSIAEQLAQGAALPAPGNQRRIWLAQRVPPFFFVGLNEWAGDGSGFLQAFFRRLHPAGAHPGLSDEEDSTFRLHMVLLVARLMLRRIAQV